MLNKNFILPEKTVSITETNRRLELLDQVRDMFTDVADIVYIGGSMATGQNHSVHPDSDLDTGVFIKPETVDNLLKSNLFDHEKLTHFIAGYKQGIAEQFSLDAFIEGIRVESHFIDQKKYLRALHEHNPHILRFRTSTVTPNVNYGFDFSGKEIETNLLTESKGDWLISPFPLYIREGNAFFPCRLLTNLIGSPIILKGEDLLAPTLDELWQWMAIELKRYRETHPAEKNTGIVKALPGNWKFSPETIKKLEERMNKEIARL